ncbi:MAG: MinD/ParA family protein, partial [Desulfobacterales bacterium]|nr:MinD/ParA family protein [Desulfobacterales bacterium]
MTKMITIASGKGGAGKTSISLNLALALADANYRICLFDADLGLANVNILTGLYPQYGLAQVMEGSHTLSDIMIRNVNGIDIIPGSSGVEKLADLTSHEAGLLIRSFMELPDYDYFLIDTSAGISSQVLSFCRACQEMILVVTPEPTSLTDAYSLLKVLSKKGGVPKVRVVINRVKTAQEAKSSYAKLKKTVVNFLSAPIFPLGVVAWDPSVSKAVVSQVPFLIKYPDAQAARCIRALGLKLVKAPVKEISMGDFWGQCLEFLEKKSPRIRNTSTTGSGQSNDGSNDLNSDGNIRSAQSAIPIERE